jgi:hypothetical protein
MPHRRVLRVTAGVGAGLLALAAVGWVGLQVPPASLPSYPPETTTAGDTVPIPTGVPAPVQRYYQAAFVDGVVPRIESAVFSGRGRMTLGPLTFPIRFRFVHQYGEVQEGYRHYFQGTWFGLPIFSANEWYLGGQLRMETPGGTIAENPTADTAANLAYWGEAVPAVLATDPRVRWEAIDPVTARLVVPSPKRGGEDAFTVHFDTATGLIRSMDVPRYRAETNELIPWQVEGSEWKTFAGQRLTTFASARWMDQPAPWITFTTEEIVTNVDVSQYIRASTP